MGGSVIAAIVAGVVLTAVAFAHAIGPALMLVAVTPFDAIPWALFGVAGNLITYVPVIIFLLKVNPGYWGQAFLGTRVQQWIAFFILVLLVSHAMLIVEKGIGEILEWLRKVTLFLLMGIFAWALRDGKQIRLLVQVAVISMTAFVVLSAMDFYLGIQLLPIKAGLLESAALDTEFEQHLATHWRFTGAGFPVNRFSNYLLPLIFLSVGWFAAGGSPLERTLSLGCTATLIAAELLTVTRSGILGMGVGLMIMLPMAFRVRPAQVVGLALVAGAVGLIAWYVVGVTSGGEVLAKRFDAGHVVQSTGGRFDRMLAAFQIWSEAPILGVGWGAFTDYSVLYVKDTGGKGAHNGYLNVLAECGLLGFIPLMIVVVSVVRRHLVKIGTLSPDHEFWRPFFFCGLASQLVTNVFNDYMWERYLWLNFAFVVVLEQVYRYEMARTARERLVGIRDLGSRLGSPQTRPS